MEDLNGEGKEKPEPGLMGFTVERVSALSDGVFAVAGLPTAAFSATVFLAEAEVVRGFAGAFAFFTFSAIQVLLHVNSRPHCGAIISRILDSVN